VTGLIDTNTLFDPFIRTVLGDGELVTLSLPGVMAACASADPNRRAASFPALRAHQAPAFHAFLAQICAMGLRRLGRETLPGADEDAWREVFRELTKDFPGDEPWMLVTAPDKPALLQPPVPGGDLSGFAEVRTPDGIDVLFTPKHHDLKTGGVANAQADDWLFALLSVQTQGGYAGGAGGYQCVARMNGGKTSRSYIHLSPPGGFSASLTRDVRRLISPQFDAWLPPTVGSRNHRPLVWVLEWGAEKDSLPLEDFDPLFVEICRRLRLGRDEDGGLIGWKTTSKGRRLDSEKTHGAVADPWTSVDISAEPKALAISSRGFTYQLCAEILFRLISAKRQFAQVYNDTIIRLGVGVSAAGADASADLANRYWMQFLIASHNYDPTTGQAVNGFPTRLIDPGE